MTTKPWPTRHKPAAYEDIADPIKVALLDAISKGDTVYEAGICWTGLEQGQFTGATCLAPDQALTAPSLTWEKEEHYRDAFDAIIGIAIQLGIEQGRRMAKRRSATWDELRMCREVLSRILEREFGEAKDGD